MATALQLMRMGFHKRLVVASFRQLGKLQSCSENMCSCNHGNRSALSWLQYRTLQTLTNKASLLRGNIFSAELSKSSDKFKNVLYRRKHQLPYEMDSNIKTDIVVFLYQNDKYYKMLTVFGIIQFFFWLNIASFAYSALDRIDSKDMAAAYPTNTVLGKVASFQTEHKTGIAGTCLVVAYLVMFFTWIYPQRTITQLKLLKGGRNLDVSTYTHFARTRTLTVPVDHFSCMQGRVAKGNQVHAKIKNRWFYFQMDKRDGQFVNHNLFDYVVGLKRDLKKK